MLVGLLWLGHSSVLAQETTATPTALPAGAISLVALGDSLTEGAQDELEKGGYPGRLLPMIEALRPGSTLSNLGHSGWNSDALITGDQGLPSELDTAVEVIDQANHNGQPAVALVWIGSNDLWYLYEYGDPDADAEADDLKHYADNLDTIMGKLTDAGAVIVIATLDDQSKRPVALKGEAFTNISRAELKRMSAQVTRYNDLIAEKAEQYGALTVDFYDTTLFTDADTLSDDGNHPNAAGYDWVAQHWFDVLKPLL